MEKKKIDLKILWRVLRLATPYRAIFIVSGILAIALAPLGIARPYIINKIVDDHIMKFDANGLLKMTIILMCLLIINAILRYFFIYLTNFLGQSVIKDLRIRVFNKISSFKMKYFDTTPIGKSTTRTINDVETINTVFSQGVMTIIADLLGVIAVLIVMSITSWRLTVICLLTTPILIFATYIFKEKVKSAFQTVRAEVANMNTFLQERISGMRIVQILNAENQEAQNFKKINHSYTQANIDTIFYYAIFFPVVEIISFSTIALMVWWGAKGYLEGVVTLGSLVAFPMYVGMLFRPIRLLADKFNTLQMGMIAAERIFDIIDKKETITDTGLLSANDIKGKVEFNDVSFSYSADTEVLSKISFLINPNETLAIVGSTGSGKSTIINLLYRFYEINTGQIKIDNERIQDYSLDSLRSKIALVLQDIFLFSGSIYDNISMKNPDISKEDVIRAAKSIGAHAQIVNLPNEYSFEVMERGENLSMGQRQLISFVRALVYNPKILILDEATSSIDVETESIIQHAIETLISKRTSIVIAHRLSTIRHANTILVLDKGQIVEFGTHNELMKLESGYYKKMYRLQFATSQAGIT